MRIERLALDASDFAQAIHQLVGTAHRAGKCAADADVELAGCRLSEARVEGDPLDDLDGFDA